MVYALHPLTKLPVRGALEEALKALLEREDEVVLALTDLDAFDAVNTDFGVETGDRVLQTVAALLDEYAPDQLFHIAGDEFALLFPGLSLEQGFLRMERLRAEVEGATERFGLPGLRPVRLTAGVAQFPRDAKDGRGLLKATSAALAVAKEGGRNQVGLPPNEDMVLKSNYYPASSLRKLKVLAERQKRKESQLLREALDDLFRKYDVAREV